jgi:hypothetical protein
MPFKSKAQRRKFAELLVEGKITPEAYEEWNRSTGGKELPERVKPKSKRSVKTRKRTKTKAKTKPKPRARSKAKAPRKTGK